MTPQERQLLESLTGRIANTPVGPKDPEADALIRQKLGGIPDALYVLTQTVLIQEMALNQANGRLHELQQEIDSHRGEQNQPTSFLGRLFGTGSSSRPFAPPPSAPPPSYTQQPAYNQPYQQPSYQQPAGQGSSFLRNAAMTATGVAAGALAFEGIESLFGHHGGFGGNAFGGGEFLGGGAPETIVNNYYDEPAGGDANRFADTAGGDGGTDFGPDTSDTSFDDSGDNSSTDDFSSTDV